MHGSQAGYRLFWECHAGTPFILLGAGGKQNYCLRKDAADPNGGTVRNGKGSYEQERNQGTGF